MKYLCQLKIINNEGLESWSKGHSGYLIPRDAFVKEIVANTVIQS